MMRFMAHLRIPLPRAYQVAADFALNSSLRNAFTDPDDLDFTRIYTLLDEVRINNVNLDGIALGFVLKKTLRRLSEQFAEHPHNLDLLLKFEIATRLARELPFEVSLWRVQNAFYAMMQRILPEKEAQAMAGHAESQTWVDHFAELGKNLSMRVQLLPEAARRMRIPATTYRLQFNSQFGLADAARIVDYLHDLGITDLYASPLMKARQGSVHGYDVTDPEHFNPEIGSEAAFEELAQQAHQKRMGILLDIVPNHMAASLENPWWVDILANGEASRFANFFDIDWSSHKVFLPILGKPYGQALESGEISIRRNNGHSALKVQSQELPVNVPAGARLDSIDDVDRVISAQPYRIGYWRKAADAINYRRFFDINDLVALRAERDEVFQATHATIVKLVESGLVDGLRIDHIDGLLDPKGYLGRLPDTYVVVEKILGADERLPADWKTQGTTGYDFLNIVNAAFIDRGGYQRLDRFYRNFSGIRQQRIEVFRERKRQVMSELFAGDVIGPFHSSPRTGAVTPPGARSDEFGKSVRRWLG